MFISQAIMKRQKENFDILVCCFIYQSVQGPQKVKVGSSDKIVTAKDIIIATGSVPFVPKGIEIDGTYQSFPFVTLIFDLPHSSFTKFSGFRLVFQLEETRLLLVTKLVVEKRVINFKLEIFFY